jgi:hypothetical protein
VIAGIYFAGFPLPNACVANDVAGLDLPKADSRDCIATVVFVVVASTDNIDPVPNASVIGSQSLEYSIEPFPALLPARAIDMRRRITGLHSGFLRAMLEGLSTFD